MRQNQNNYYSYVANGIQLFSEIEMPELQIGNGEGDVYILLGEVPDKILNPQFNGAKAQAGDNKFMLTIDKVATYFIEKINDQFIVTIKVKEKAKMADVRVFILSSVLGALSFMKNMLPLHASGTIIDGSAVLFTGNAGVGKSTLGAAFYKKGYSFLTDNIASIVKGSENNYLVHPSYSQLRLWEDSLERLENFEEEKWKMREKVNKYNMVLNDRISISPSPLRKIYVLKQKQTNTININPIYGSQKVELLLRQTFRIKLLKGIGSQKNYFDLLNHLSKDIEVSVIERPTQTFQLDDLVNAVLNDLNCNPN